MSPISQNCCQYCRALHVVKRTTAKVVSFLLHSSPRSSFSLNVLFWRHSRGLRLWQQTCGQSGGLPRSVTHTRLLPHYLLLLNPHCTQTRPQSVPLFSLRLPFSHILQRADTLRYTNILLLSWTHTDDCTHTHTLLLHVSLRFVCGWWEHGRVV